MLTVIPLGYELERELLQELQATWNDIENCSTQVRAEKPTIEVANREINKIRTQISQLRRKSGANQVSWTNT